MSAVSFRNFATSGCEANDRGGFQPLNFGSRVMSQPLWKGRCDPQAPLLVIGAGRSGSSLLTGILDAHPEICFKGENLFLLPKLWQVVWDSARPRQ